MFAPDLIWSCSYNLLYSFYFSYLHKSHRIIDESITNMSTDWFGRGKTYTNNYDTVWITHTHIAAHTHSEISPLLCDFAHRRSPPFEWLRRPHCERTVKRTPECYCIGIVWAVSDVCARRCAYYESNDTCTASRMRIRCRTCTPHRVCSGDCDFTLGLERAHIDIQPYWWKNAAWKQYASTEARNW